jgi:hypothetical protein
MTEGVLSGTLPEIVKIGYRFTIIFTHGSHMSAFTLNHEYKSPELKQQTRDIFQNYGKLQCNTRHTSIETKVAQKMIL